MKVKLPITEKFLWSIYTILEDAGRINEAFGRRSFTQVLCPEMKRIRDEVGRKIGRRRFSKLVYHLKKSGFIKAPDWDPKVGIIVTKKGMQKIFRTKLKLQGKKKRADKKWEMVVFDISEKKRAIRDEMRFYLKALGYQKFQQSIWISPFDVLKETQQLIQSYDLENEVKIFLVEEP